MSKNPSINLHALAFYTLQLFLLFNLYSYLVLGELSSYLTYLLYFVALLFFVFRVHLFLKAGFRINSDELLSFIFIMLIVFALVAQTTFQSSVLDVEGIDSAVYTNKMFVVSLFWFFAGAACAYSKSVKSVLISIAIVTFASFTVFQAAGDSFVLNYSQLANESNLKAISHLHIADYLLVNFMFAYVCAGRFRILVLISSVLALFALGGRTAVYIGLLSFIIYELFVSSYKAQLKALLYVVIASAILFYLFNYLLTTGVIDTDSKMVQKLIFAEGLEDDSSFEGRLELWELGLSNLEASFWIGNPSLIANDGKDGMGAYMHNLLSAWQFFGFFVFLVLGVILFKSFNNMRDGLQRSQDPIRQTNALILIYVLIAIVLSKAITFKLLWFAIGYWCLGYRSSLGQTAVRSKVRRRRRRKRSVSTR